MNSLRNCHSFLNYIVVRGNDVTSEGKSPAARLARSMASAIKCDLHQLDLGRIAKEPEAKEWSSNDLERVVQPTRQGTQNRPSIVLIHNGHLALARRQPEHSQPAEPQPFIEARHLINAALIDKGRNPDRGLVIHVLDIPESGFYSLEKTVTHRCTIVRESWIRRNPPRLESASVTGFSDEVGFLTHRLATWLVLTANCQL